MKVFKKKKTKIPNNITVDMYYWEYKGRIVYDIESIVDEFAIKLSKLVGEKVELLHTH